MADKNRQRQTENAGAGARSAARRSCSIGPFPTPVSAGSGSKGRSLAAKLSVRRTPPGTEHYYPFRPSPSSKKKFTRTARQAAYPLTDGHRQGIRQQNIRSLFQKIRCACADSFAQFRPYSLMASLKYSNFRSRSRNQIHEHKKPKQLGENFLLQPAADSGHRIV